MRLQACFTSHYKALQHILPHEIKALGRLPVDKSAAGKSAT